MKSWLKNHSSPLILLLFVITFCSLISFISLTKIHFERGGSVDYPIFISTSEAYQYTKQLYEHTDNLPDTYRPSSANYKYPPPFALTVFPWMKERSSMSNFYTITRGFMLAMYIFSFFFITKRITSISPSHPKQENSAARQKTMFICLSIILLSWFYPYRGTLGFTTEIFILFLITIGFILSDLYPYLSGSAIGIAFSFKIYPIFLLFYFVFNKNWKVFAGFIISTLIAYAVSILYFGLEENIFFFSKILPIILVEKTTDNINNFNLEYILFANHLIPEINGEIFFTSKIVILCLLLTCGIFYNPNLPFNRILFYGMCITAMLLCLANYWLQYQMILVFPLLAIIGYAFSQNRKTIFAISIFLFILMIINSDFLSRIVLNDYIEQKNIAPEIFLETAKNIGVNAAVLQVSYVAWFCFWLGKLGELRVIAPWIMLFLFAYILLKEKIPADTGQGNAL